MITCTAGDCALCLVLQLPAGLWTLGLMFTFSFYPHDSRQSGREITGCLQTPELTNQLLYFL